MLEVIIMVSIMALEMWVTLLLTEGQMVQFLNFKSNQQGKSCSNTQCKCVTVGLWGQTRTEPVAAQWNWTLTSFESHDDDKRLLGLDDASLSRASFYCCLSVCFLGPHLPSSAWSSWFLLISSQISFQTRYYLNLQQQPQQMRSRSWWPRCPVNLCPICCSSTRPVGQLRCLGKTEN